MSAAGRGGPAAGGRAAGPAAGAARGTRVLAHRNPVRLLFSASPWRAAWFLAGYVFVTGWVLFAVAFTATVTAAVCAITIAGIPLLVVAAAVLRGCAAVERGRLRQVLAEPVRGRYRKVRAPGYWAAASSRWRDPATWRDAAYLIGLWGPLLALDTAVLTVWLTILTGITLPAWYWAPRREAVVGYSSVKDVPGLTLGYFPHGPHGPGGVGLYVDTLPAALLAAACFLVLFLVFNYVLVITARAHASIARSLLRAPPRPPAAGKSSGYRAASRITNNGN
jgi:hypothetical protein